MSSISRYHSLSFSLSLSVFAFVLSGAYRVRKHINTNTGRMATGVRSDGAGFAGTRRHAQQPDQRHARELPHMADTDQAAAPIGSRLLHVPNQFQSDEKADRLHRRTRYDTNTVELVFY